MPGGRFNKFFQFKGQQWNANNANDAQVGGALTVAPAGSGIGSQAFSNVPGDRAVLSPMDAVTFQNNNVGNLYTGTYRYVQPANSVSTPARGHGAFWVPVVFSANNFNQAAQDNLYQVTSDEAASYGVSLFAGVFINSPGKGNNNIYWWIQESGKVAVQFRTAIGGAQNTTIVPAIGAGVYLTAGGNNNNAIDVGSFDQINGLNAGVQFSTANANGANSAYTAIDNALVRFVGVAEQLPSNNNISVIDMSLSRFYRW